MPDVVDDLVTALNAHDLDAVTALLHEDYRSEQPAHPGRAFRGRGTMRANWEAMFAGVPDFRAELLRSVTDAGTAWCEWRWSGTRADGTLLDVRGVTLFELEAGRIVAGTLYVEDTEHAGPEHGDVRDAVQELSGRRPSGPAA